MGLNNTGLPASPIYNQDGSISTVWLSFFNSLSDATNSANGFLNQANSPQNPPNEFFATPSNAAGIAAFRELASADLAPLSGQYPGSATGDNAAAGNMGEYLSNVLAPANALALTTAVTADILTLGLSPGDWDVWGSIGTTVSAGSITVMNAWLNESSATDPGPPNSGAYFQFASSLSAGAQSLTTGPISAPLGQMRLSIAQAATVYLSTTVAFSGTVKGFGFIGARRRR